MKAGTTEGLVQAHWPGPRCERGKGGVHRAGDLIIVGEEVGGSYVKTTGPLLEVTPLHSVRVPAWWMGDNRFV